MTRPAHPRVGFRLGRRGDVAQVPAAAAAGYDLVAVPML